MIAVFGGLGAALPSSVATVRSPAPLPSSSGSVSRGPS
jgi:hypothetical protein